MRNPQMQEFILMLIAFIVGVIVSKNLVRWVRLKFVKDPRGAIQAEIDNLKALADSYRK